MTAEVAPEYTAQREVKSRRIKFKFDDREIKHHFVDNDPAMSHLVAMLSAGFPPGEESFIRSVHHYKDQVSDPQLQEQVKGFIGQEMTHGREHRALNETLSEMGYPTKLVEQGSVYLEFIEKVVPPIIPLSMTAAAEHFTATLAARVLSNRDYIDDVATDVEMRGVLNWHAFEELEHKAVAFDVFRHVGGSETVRIGTMLVVLPASVAISTIGMLASMALDPAVRRHPVRSLISVLRVPGNPIFRNVIPELAQYLKPGFHPDHMETDDLLEESRERLFGADGELVHNLK